MSLLLKELLSPPPMSCRSPLHETYMNHHNHFYLFLDYINYPTCGFVRWGVFAEAEADDSGFTVRGQAGGRGPSSTATAGRPETGTPEAVVPVSRVRQEFPEALIWTESRIG